MGRRTFSQAAVVLVVLVVVAVLAGCGAGTTARPPAAGPDPVVTTDAGQVRGVARGAVATFAGIPYAAPPVGALRFTDPRPAPRWAGVREAREPGSDCVRKAPEAPSGVTGSEDCLFLNVAAPAAPSAGLPVLFYVHGGNAESSGREFDGTRMAAAGAVVVTMNYRLGVFGFLGLPELAGATNFGFADLQAAMGWVRRNAAAFGGDPRNVSLIGESAGAYNICAQLTAPGSAGLFEKAIMHSGPCSLRVPKGGLIPGQVFDPFVTRAVAEKRGTATAAGVGCTKPGAVLACLRSVPTATLGTVEKPSAFSFPVYGVPSLPQRPDAALRAGRFHPVPVLQGTMLDETRTFVDYQLGGLFVGPYRIDGREYDRLLTTAFGAKAAQVRAAYPVSAYPTPALAWSTVTTDASFACQAVTDSAALAGRAPVHAFEFADRDAPVPPALLIPPVADFPLGAAHGVDLPYLQPTAAGFAAPQQALSEQMIGYWMRFARTGDPGGGDDGPAWPAFAPGAENVLTLNTAPAGTSVSSDFRARHHCDLWARVPFS